MGEYRLLQGSMEKILIRVVPLAASSAGELAQLRDRLSDRLGRGARCDVDLAAELPDDPSEKTRLSRSRVTPIYDGMDWSTVR